MATHQNSFKNKRTSFAQKLFFKLLSKIQYGKITLIEGDNRFVFCGQQATPTQSVTITVKHVRVYKMILFGGSIGAGKSYIKGDWSTDDLTKLLEIFIHNTTLFSNIEGSFAKFIIFVRNLVDKVRPNNIKRAKKNILEHYDLGNEFFELFLDPTMMYSCAIYDEEHTNQNQASIKKLRTICDHLQLNSKDHILEIGTGWGGFAIFAAREYGCKVTTTTISDKQYNFVKTEIKRLGLEKQIELLNIDYRELTSQYDKLVSIEMIEAVGYKYYDTFFSQCNNLVKPGGLFFLQAIVINDQAYERAKIEIDFIKYYIFPGGCLPSIYSISDSIKNHSQMQLLYLNDIGKHYVNTLNDWHKKFLENFLTIKKQNFSDRFIRMWQFYFCYCAAGFKTNYISNIHALWRKRI
jgi:cyclopropane-fatty-acyl-phospholipid synthase